MTNEEYSATQHRLTLIGGLLRDMDLAGFISMIDSSHAVAPILDPTLYRKAAGRLVHLRAMAMAANELKKAHAELDALVMKEEVARYR